METFHATLYLLDGDEQVGYLVVKQIRQAKGDSLRNHQHIYQQQTFVNIFATWSLMGILSKWSSVVDFNDLEIIGIEKI